MEPAGERARVILPRHVAVRRVGDETVVLNLQTGNYHGLDEAGGAFLEALQRTGHIGAAVDELTVAYAADRQRISADMETFCGQLADRGLIEIDRDAGA